MRFFGEESILAAVTLANKALIVLGGLVAAARAERKPKVVAYPLLPVPRGPVRAVLDDGAGVTLASLK